MVIIFRMLEPDRIVDEMEAILFSKMNMNTGELYGR